jgi:hypothetical protein
MAALQTRDISPVHNNVPTFWLFGAVEQAEKGGLTSATRTSQKDHLTLGDMKGDGRQCGRLGVIGLTDIKDLDHRLY